jgi:hypothetical protein
LLVRQGPDLGTPVSHQQLPEGQRTYKREEEKNDWQQETVNGLPG